MEFLRNHYGAPVEPPVEIIPDLLNVKSTFAKKLGGQLTFETETPSLETPSESALVTSLFSLPNHGASQGR